MSSELIKIQISSPRHSLNSIGVLVDLNFDEEGNCSSASRLIWFPKIFCNLEEIDYSQNFFGKLIVSKRYFITAPKWFLDEHNIKYKI